MLSSVVCTLYEGHYQFGLGALVNSLYYHGFRGLIWVGYRGSLPFWTQPSHLEGDYQEFHVGEGCVIRFVRLEYKLHFANYKPHFMLKVLNHYCMDADRIFYFDPDIVIRCRWSFFDAWADKGVALCQEIVNGYMPDDHPIRLSWNDLMRHTGYVKTRSMYQYFNSGFIGLKREASSILCAWQDFLDRLEACGQDLISLMPGDRSNTFYTVDQDALNLSTMVTNVPLSTIGPEGMGFVSGGFTMLHATGTPKPWKKRMILEALKGSPPGNVDRGYWQHTQTPINLYSPQQRMLKILDLHTGAAIGRFIRRS